MKLWLKTLVAVHVIAVVLLIGLVLSNENRIENVAIAKVQSKQLELIIADTPQTREKGLSKRPSLPENTAMLFIFDTPARHVFWMKDMRFAIDIIWLDQEFEVVHIESNVSPDTFPARTFSPPDDSLYVLETKAGFTETVDLKIGDVVEVVLN